MNKLFLLLGVVVALSGCKTEEEQRKEMESDRTGNYTSSYDLPERLEGCEIFYVKSRTQLNLFITRCPNSTVATHYRTGKSSSTTSTSVSE